MDHLKNLYTELISALSGHPLEGLIVNHRRPGGDIHLLDHLKMGGESI